MIKKTYRWSRKLIADQDIYGWSKKIIDDQEN